MVEIVTIAPSDLALVRLEAARIHKMRRRLSRERALIEFDRIAIHAGMRSGLRRGDAICRADALGDALRARLDELDAQSASAPKATVHRLQQGAAA